MAAATTSFLREAETVLRGGGYELERTSGKQHGVWRHPDPERPDIVVPKTPGRPEFALVHIRRAVRRGTSTHIPRGMEREMPPKAPTTTPQWRLHEALVELATPEMKRRKDTLDRGEPQPEPLTRQVLGKWMRKCLEEHGAIPNAELNQAAEILHLAGTQLSVAREQAGAKSYRHLGDEDRVYTTDFAGRVPAGAFVPPGRRSRTIVLRDPEPVAPAEAGGLGLSTPATNGSENRDDDEPAGRPSDAPLLPSEAAMEKFMGETLTPLTNGSRPRTQLDEALDLVREAALADTRALTSDDIELLSNIRDDLVRHRIDLETITSGLEDLLTRVGPRVATHA